MLPGVFFLDSNPFEQHFFGKFDFSKSVCDNGTGAYKSK